MKRPSLSSTGSLNRMLQAAEEAWSRKEFQKCIELLERASRLDPANAGILLRLGRVYGLRYEFEAAERCFEKAIRVAPNKTEALASAAENCRGFTRSELAERYFCRAVEQSDAAPETYVKLAEHYERLQRPAEARSLVERALHAEPQCALASLTLARLERQAGRLHEAEQALRPMLPSSAGEIRVRAWYELGAILDRQERYHEAMAAFLEAKALLRPGVQSILPHLELSRSRLRQLQANLSRDIVRCWLDSRPLLPPSRKLALLCGHPRSGTTLLEQVLDSHPDIVSVDEREVFYDDVFAPLTRALPEGALMLPVLEAASLEALRKSRDCYFHRMELCVGGPIGDRLLTDKNPSYTLFIPAYLRVLPETKFLIALRDPRDVCLSCLMLPHFMINQATAAYVSLEEVVKDYTGLMSLWRTLAPLMEGCFIEVRYEEMVEDLESVARRTLGFLDIGWDERVLQFSRHARQKTLRAPTYAEVARPVFKTAMGRWRNYQKYLEPHLEKLEPFVKAFGYE
jgi:tetratricopeptide (TPR) repeat protein